MDTLAYPPSFIPTFFDVVAASAKDEPLVQLENVVEFIGDDPDTHRQVFALSRDLIEATLPELREAMTKGDHPAVCRIAHRARGSLGMLGVPHLQQMTMEIEYNRDELGLAHWRQRCQQLCEMLENLRKELSGYLAA